MASLTVDDARRLAEDAIARIAAGRRGTHVVAQAVCGGMIAGDLAEDTLLLEVTGEEWRAIREEDLTHLLPRPLPGRLFLMSLSQTTFAEMLRAGDPRLLAAAQGHRILLDRRGWLAKRLRAAVRPRARARR